MLTDADYLHSMLDTSPNDWSSRLVLADLLEERGDINAALLQKWLAINKRHPNRNLGLCSDSFEWQLVEKRIEYCRADEPTLQTNLPSQNDAPNILGANLFLPMKLLANSQSLQENICRLANRKEAEAALLKALIATSTLQWEIIFPKPPPFSTKRRNHEI
jgi:hypothetical protein